jgi:hypothetical protein
MMYKKNYVLALKIGGKILRETSESVEIPFGYEYSVLLKNLHGVRATAALSVNGTEVGTFVVPANGEIEIERFMKNGNMRGGNKFKFIERTEQIEEARGIQVDDGLVRVEFKKEYIQPPIVWQHSSREPHYVFPVHLLPRPYWNDNTLTCTSGGLTRSAYSGSPLRGMMTNSSSQQRSRGPCGQSAAQNNFSYAAQNCQIGASSGDAVVAAAGITVPGGISDQQFSIGQWFATEPGSEVLVLHLMGTHGKKKVERPVTVDIRPVCQTCQKRSKSNAHFCKHCGTSLHII